MDPARPTDTDDYRRLRGAGLRVTAQRLAVLAAVRHAPCLVPGDASGYLVDEAEVTFWGVCPTYQITDQPIGVA